MPLSLKHQAFVDEYLKDRNATQAVIRVGYKADNANRTATRLLSDVQIQEAIAARSQIAAGIANLTTAKVIERMNDLYEKAVAAEEYSAAAKVLEMQGRYLAMFTDNHRVTIAPDEREARLRAIFDRN